MLQLYSLGSWLCQGRPAIPPTPPKINIGFGGKPFSPPTLRSWPPISPFFASSNAPQELLRKKHRKKCENRRFWPPKTVPKRSPNTSKIEVLKNKRFFVDFGLKSPISQKCRCLFRTTKTDVLLTSDHFLQTCARGLDKSKKPTKNLSKMRSEPSKNRCRKCVVFQHRFFRVSASILDPLGPPRWSQVRRAACSARRVRAHCIYACINILLLLA